ncbi:MoaD/ThiS family protein [Pseudoxanthomonas composti]|uniref:Molybdopterin synthase sulfur carrier subunit n=1 Tax=Pseudoxanthomonas composti TaxID=2137479 RepID=A0A4Q1JUA4_9GAMM|nr:MoaD/ThiS family protein [Pseudoxanthomonas composti]RXR05204.1 MoaD/ThiS family protein [Pseudoxanthomonas composti]
MTAVTVLYFASLRQAAGVEQETVQTEASDLAGLYAQLRERHELRFDTAHLRVAVDDVFAQWGDALRQGSRVAFIPPVSGG